MQDILNYSHYVLETKVLGPFVRSALWVSGCCFKCEGCIAEEMNQIQGRVISPEDMANVFINEKSTEGITISGGEPFLQSEPLTKMINAIKSSRDYGVIVYTGFTLEELRERNEEKTKKFLDKIDILIDGRYKKELDDGKPYRGSSNQRIIMLTDRYKEVCDAYYLKRNREMEIQVGVDYIYMVGVPSREGAITWRKLKDKAEGKIDGVGVI